jgi:hypothetical protein
MGMDALYLEAHVTFDPIPVELEEKYKEICNAYAFRPAELFMRKGYSEFVPARMDAFCTGRGSMLRERIKHIVFELKKIGVKVRRYKIESTLMDSNYQDELGVLA